MNVVAWCGTRANITGMRFVETAEAAELLIAQGYTVRALCYADEVMNERDRQQSQVDALTFEFCPERMTREQEATLTKRNLVMELAGR